MDPSEYRILVTGAAGLLGTRLVSVMARKHFVVAAVYMNHPALIESASLVVEKCDLTDTGATAGLLRKADPDVIINCAAMTDVDGCERSPELAERLNPGIVGNLLTSASAKKTHFLQISTDYVFDGAVGRYPEDSVPSPVNVYGVTKLRAEARVLSWPGSSLIVRTSALYDCRPTVKPNLFGTTYRRLQLGRRVEVAEDLYCNPIWVVNLSEAVCESVEKRLRGIINIAGPEYLSRLRFSQLIAEHYGFPSELVKGVSVAGLGLSAARPLRAGLDVSRACRVLSARLLSPRETLSHPEFAPD